jgi:hypothetical protein
MGACGADNRRTMTDGAKKNALTREAILTLLSDAEIAKVSRVVRAVGRRSERWR